ncbi:MAG TPA: phosphoenolpyruvate synthase [Deltaproteobacteria bacterium]|nr:phosphoenolpyruvate synthase [Deltaproteobacteria bacterium]
MRENTGVRGTDGGQRFRDQQGDAGSRAGTPVTSGIASFDTVVDRLRMGDNVVWQVSDLEDYRYFVQSFLAASLAEQRKVIYIRFADHAPLVEEGTQGVRICYLDPRGGFEPFSSEVFRIIEEEGRGAFYIFDCLSNLLSEWATDLMVGNFFVITCPYLFELDTIAYFALIRDSHSYQTVARIRETTQLLIDVFNENKRMYVHPLKVWQRYSPTMFLPHLKEEAGFTPIVSSVEAATLFSEIRPRSTERGGRSLDYWDRLFLAAGELLERPWESAKKQGMVDRICRIMMSRESRMSILVKENFSLEDLVRVRERLIGTGLIGGKATGMLVARKILEKDETVNWHELMEAHDSFYIGSDVFYTYIVQNGWWKLRMEQKTEKGYFEAGRFLRDRLRTGSFPQEIREQFMLMLEYFGQSPIIVRSSSLLEDNFGNAFAGKYESVFLANQGTPEERYRCFEEAVRTVYSSTMNEDALAYRLQRGMADADEQMALLVQRVSGSHHGRYFFPDFAGVGLSRNIFVWSGDMKPEAGMLRLVFGLGTRAVNRVEGDYPRIVALDAPLKLPHAGLDDKRRFSQREVDLLNLEENRLVTMTVLDLMGEKLDVHLDRIAERDHEINEQIRERGLKQQEAWIITFDELFSRSAYPRIMQDMLKKLETMYQYPMDTEFTVNFTKDNNFRINLLQCRPLQTIGTEQRIEFPVRISDDRIFIRAEGNFFGGSMAKSIHRVIYIRPLEYNKLNQPGKYETARLVGRLNGQVADRETQSLMLLGPGRWGSTTPSLGVPVRFSDINNVTVLGEVAWTDGNLMPELSYGSHFFQDLVETGIFYLAIFPELVGVKADFPWLERFPNRLAELAPDFAGYADVVGVYDVGETDLWIVADVVKQKVICFHA